jgi:hypothetical protein
VDADTASGESGDLVSVAYRRRRLREAERSRDRMLADHEIRIQRAKDFHNHHLVDVIEAEMAMRDKLYEKALVRLRARLRLAEEDARANGEDPGADAPAQATDDVSRLMSVAAAFSDVDELAAMMVAASAQGAPLPRLAKGIVSYVHRKQKLEKFFMRLVDHFGGDQHLQMEACDFEDWANQDGLIRFEKYDPEKHGADVDAVPGEDLVWALTDD